MCEEALGIPLACVFRQGFRANHIRVAIAESACPRVFYIAADRADGLTIQSSTFPASRQSRDFFRVRVI
jgi:hypothetical protein